MDLQEPTSTLSPGVHRYEDVMAGVREGRYRFAQVRTASGRLQPIVGVSPEQFAAIEAEARRSGLGFVLIGSRVCGPRTRQKELHPVLEAAVPLKSTRRSPSATYPGSEGVEIDKRAIKEHGIDSVHTSDLQILIVDPRRLPIEELRAAAVRIERHFKTLGCTFPVRVHAETWGDRFYSETDFVAFARDRLLSLAHAPGSGFSEAEIQQAIRELYAPVNLPRPWFTREDVATGLWNGALASVSFWAAFKLHPIVFAVGFAFGLCGRRLARLKASLARGEGETFASNLSALGVDWGLGVAAMGGLINPIAGLGVPFSRVLWTSALHTLSKGSMRLYLEKHYSKGTHRRQSEGVVIVTSINFVQGLATSYIYAGSGLAALFQVLMGLAGILLAFEDPLRRLLKRRAPALV